MGKINILDKHTAELIAAGEVVERPSSVVKELVENAVDAGARHVSVEIRDGGLSYIRVTDDGEGIAAEDVRAAFLRNATSKVRTAADLEDIGTLGFRGEALASVCSVAKVTMQTRHAGKNLGIIYKIYGGEEKIFDETGHATGTTIEVQELFYNVPARMKFMKKVAVESRAVAKVLDVLVLSCPDVAFKFVKDGKQELISAGTGELRDAIFAVYGAQFAKELAPVDYALNGVRVQGFIARPEFSRGTRSMQHFFVNGRCVNVKTAQVALESAFKGRLMVQRYPACVLNLYVPSASVDVNIHPAKLEVRFVDEKRIFDAVFYAVKSALMLRNEPILLHETCEAEPSFASPAEKTPENSLPNPQTSPAGDLRTFLSRKTPETSPVSLNSQANLVPQEEQLTAESHQRPIGFEPKALKGEMKRPDDGDFKPNFEEEPQQVEIFSQQEQTPLDVIKEIFGTYILLEKGPDELVFIDKHAAHERILYEKQRMAPEPCAQRLLEAVVVPMSRDEHACVLENAELFQAAGFEIDDFGGNTLVVRSVPLWLGREDAREVAQEMAGHLLENCRDVAPRKLEWLRQNIACRAAVKAGDKISKEEMLALVRALEREENLHCPHGRPIVVSLHRRDIERRFGRI